MTNPNVVLSIFPGIGLLDRAFEQEGWCVVRGPDVLWGGDIRTFHPPSGVFAGVIGGPPCQTFSKLIWMVHANGHEARFGNLIPEYVRVCEEAQPDWFVMENVPEAPMPDVAGYVVRHYLLNNRSFMDKNGRGAQQQRTRRFSFGTYDGRPLRLDIALVDNPQKAPAVLGNTGGGKLAPLAISFEQLCVLQGLPPSFGHDMPFTVSAKRRAIGNGVPIPMGRAIARAVRRTFEVTV